MKELDVQIRYLDSGRWNLFDDRDKEQTYIIAADSASGLPNRNGSAGCVLCLETHKIVASICGEIAPEDFAVELEKAARYFNKGEIVVEYEKYGMIVLHILRDKYPFIYSHSESLVGTEGNRSKILGWNPVLNRNRQIAIDLLKMDVGYSLSNNPIERSRAIVIPDKSILLEMNDFVRNNENGKEEAAPGKKDDRVSSIYIANFVWHERMQYRKPKVAKQEDTFWDLIRKMERPKNERSLGERQREY